MTLAQILALVIFLVMFGVIMWGKIHRYIPALVGGGLVIVLIFLIIERDPHMVTSVLNLGSAWTRLNSGTRDMNRSRPAE